MGELDDRYAGKFPPDNAIVRIEALEKLTRELRQNLFLNSKKDEENLLQDKQQEERISKLEQKMKKALEMIEKLSVPFDTSHIMALIKKL